VREVLAWAHTIIVLRGSPDPCNDKHKKDGWEEKRNGKQMESSWPLRIGPLVVDFPLFPVVYYSRRRP